MPLEQMEEGEPEVKTVVSEPWWELSEEDGPDKREQIDKESRRKMFLVPFIMWLIIVLVAIPVFIYFCTFKNDGGLMLILTIYWILRVILFFFNVTKAGNEKGLLIYVEAALVAILLLDPVWSCLREGNEWGMNQFIQDPRSLQAGKDLAFWFIAALVQFICLGGFVLISEEAIEKKKISLKWVFFWALSPLLAALFLLGWILMFFCSALKDCCGCVQKIEMPERNPNYEPQPKPKPQIYILKRRTVPPYDTYYA